MNTQLPNLVGRFGLRVLTIVLLAGVSIGSAFGQQLKDAPPVKSLDDLKQLSTKVIAMTDRCVAATVCLMSPNGQGAGSGVIINADGLILTAAHVRAAIGEEVVVIFNDGTRKPAKCLGADNDRDAALVQLSEKGPYPYAKMGSSDNLLRNQWCVAIGHPGGFDPTRPAPLRLGRVLQNTRFITTDSAIVGGDSGGPLFDTDGNVIGIHSNIGASLSENRHVPIKAFSDYWDAMKKGESRGTRFAGNEGSVDPNRTILGTDLEPTTEAGGVPVGAVLPNSPAEKAGIKTGDIITGLDMKPVETREKLIASIGQKKPGDKVTISLTRGEEKKDIEVTLGRLGDMLRQQTPPEGNPQPEGENPNGERPRNRRPRPEEEKAPTPAPTPDKAEVEAPKPDKAAAVRPKFNSVYFETQDATKEAPKPAPKERPKDEPKDQPKDDLDRFLDQAFKIKNGRMDIELNPEAIAKFGLDKILRRARERAEKLGIKPGRREGGQGPGQSRPQPPDEFFIATFSVLNPVTATANESTVLVLVDDKPAALGTVVAADGLILTKNSETANGKVTIQIGTDKLEAELVQRFASRDLAAYKVNRTNLNPIHWIDENASTPVGSVLTIPDSEGKPIGIGLVSVLPRTMGKVGYLGVQTMEGEGGVLIQRVLEGGAAETAGLKNGDLVTALNGQKCASAVEFSYVIRRLRAGDKVKVEFEREGKTESLEATLNGRETGGRESGRARMMDEMSGPLSLVMGGFPEALQHDIPILPEQCGGPLLNLDGQCIGINVSRAGRVKTFAIPVTDIRAVLAEIEETAKPKVEAPAKIEAPAKKAG